MRTCWLCRACTRRTSRRAWRRGWARAVEAAALGLGLAVVLYRPFWQGPATLTAFQRTDLFTASLGSVMRLVLEPRLGLESATTLARTLSFSLFAVLAVVGLREAGIQLPPTVPESLLVIGLGSLATIFVLIRLISIPDEFLPEGRTEAARLVLAEARSGTAAGLILIGIEGAEPADLARLSLAVAAALPDTVPLQFHTSPYTGQHRRV